MDKARHVLVCWVLAVVVLLAVQTVTAHECSAGQELDVQRGVPSVLSKKAQELATPRPQVNAPERLASPPFTLSPGASRYLESSRRIQIGIPAQKAPLGYFDEKGFAQGIYAAFLTALNERLGGRLEAVPLDEDNKALLFKTSRHPDAVMGAIRDLPEGSLFSAPFFRSTLVLIMRRDVVGSDFTLESLQGKKVVLLDSELSHYQDSMADRKFETVRVSNLADAFHMVEVGEVDALVVDRLLAEEGIINFRGNDLRVHPLNLERLYFFGVDEEQPELVEVLNAALGTMTQRERENLVALWHSGSTNPLRLTNTDKEWLGAHSNLTMGVTNKWLPFEYVGINGEYQGVVGEYARWLSGMLGLEFVLREMEGHDKMLAALAAGELDVVAGAAWSEERAQKVLFTQPYLRLPLVLAMRRDSSAVSSISDLRGKKVAVVQGFLSESILRNEYPHIRVVTVPSTHAGLAMLADGDVDAMFDTLDTITYCNRTYSYANLVIAATTSYVYELCFAVSRTNPELVALLDKALEALPPEKARMFYDQWVQARATSVMDWNMFWRLVAVVLGVVSLIVAAIIYGNRRLRAQVSERRNAENALMAVLSNLPGVFCMCDTDLRFQFVNQEFTHMYDIDADHAKGHSLVELYSADAVGETRLERAKQYENTLRDALRTGVPVVLEHYVGEGEDRVWFVTRHVPLFNELGQVYGLVSLASDISSSKRLEQQLSAQLSYIQSLLDTLPNPVLLQDTAGRYTLVNQTLENMTGVDSTTLLGKTALDNALFSVGDRLRIHKDVQILLREGGSARREVRFCTELEPEGTALLSLSAFCPYAGSIGGVVSVMADITDHKRLEKQLNFAREVAESATRAQSEFLANMSHEIRTPMNAILGLCHLVRQTQLSAVQADYMQKLDGSAEVLLGILNDILDFSKIEAGKLELEREPFLLSDALNTVKTVLDLASMQKSVRTSCEIMPDVPAQVCGDPLRLTQILINLVNNAIKFTDHGEIAVCIELDKVADLPADIQNTTMSVRFSVRDTGIGMSDHQISRLFQAFSQGDASITRRYGGTGLGLAISRQLVEAMGGTMSVESHEGQGSTFSFNALFTPAGSCVADLDAVEPEPSHASATASATAPATDMLGGKRALLVEDNDINQLVAQELLRSEGLVVDIASNGAEAVDLVKKSLASARGYDIILMDIQMPVMDGLTAARVLRAEPELAAMPIVAMTAHAMDEDRRKSHEAGMTEHLTKPIMPAELRAVLTRLLAT